MKNKRGIQLARVFLLVVMVVCLIPVIRAWYLSIQQKLQQDIIKERKEVPEGYAAGCGSVPGKIMEALADKGIQTADRGKGQTGGGPVILSRYAGLYEENHDLAGWLAIEGMKVDYPVMRNGDDEYYLHHDFYGQDSKYGCLYVRNRADLENGTNFIIYGHNMRDGSMFGDLDMYLKEEFYRQHKTISFDTLYEERIYEVIAVFRSQVYDEEEDAFKYYRFYEASTEEEFDEFYRNIKNASLYDTGVEARFGDTFLTLSTCAYHVEDGRFVVVAKRTG